MSLLQIFPLEKHILCTNNAPQLPAIARDGRRGRGRAQLELTDALTFHVFMSKDLLKGICSEIVANALRGY